jgi:pyruvate dehydrogenase E1 component alpha subunit
MHLADFSVGSLGESGIVGSGVPVAVGAALSASVRGTDQVALAFFGDGAANAGPVHEAMNLASVWKLPAIFYCENNGFAITVPMATSTSVVDISDRAAGYSMPGVTVDGQDVLAVYEVTAAAVARARRGEGPSLIEAKTYRTREHAEGLFLDYRDQEEIDAWAKRDPIKLFDSWLVSSDTMTAKELVSLRAEVEAELDEAVSFALDSEMPAPEEAFEDLYTNPLPASRFGGAR